jgi:glutamate 5-kinase
VLLDGQPLARLAPEDAAELIASGAATGGMIAKLEAARAALDAGVCAVRIGDAAAIADARHGTLVAPVVAPTDLDAPAATLRAVLPIHA